MHCKKPVKHHAMSAEISDGRQYMYIICKTKWMITSLCMFSLIILEVLICEFTPGIFGLWNRLKTNIKFLGHSLKFCTYLKAVSYFCVPLVC